VDRFSGQPRKGCDILVQALEREVRRGRRACGVVMLQSAGLSYNLTSCK
jgi:hypothetical protein